MVENVTLAGDRDWAVVTRSMRVRVLTYVVKVTVAPTLGLAGEQFVSLTTFRRDGTPVPTPVWIAQDGDALVVTTPAGTGKVKRLRHDPRVELRPCNRRGTVPDGAVPTSGLAEVLAPQPRHLEALRRKYGVQYRIGTVVERLVRGRRERVILRIILAEPAP